MKINKLDNIEFRLKELHDFSWLKKYGEAFWIVDETGSGCVCVGMKNGDTRLFCKIAGVNTVEAEVSPEESVRILKNAVHLYTDLAHPHLIKLIEHYEYNDFYVAVFQWADGECLFDHWNFEIYKKNPQIKSPKQRFKALPAAKKIKAVDSLFSFLQNVNEKGYTAVDFYDGSLMYDFASDTLTVCDIDLFRKAPVINDIGTDWFGTKRLKAPEEYRKGSAIDQQTNLFTLGALIFEFFGNFSDEEMKQRYITNRFEPCSLSNWELGQESYQVAIKAVEADKNRRWGNFAEFFKAWKNSDT